jgi:glycosyltransferase involved in cell wall biosynthesis
MLSRGEWLPKAIACFKAQTYVDRRLILVADRGMGGLLDLIADDSRISVIETERPGGKTATVGEKRNAGNAASLGDVIVHWDDDDFSAPERIADQIERLQSGAKAVTGYHSMLFTDGKVWWKNSNTPEWAFDTSLCYLRSFWEAHPFPDINDGCEENLRIAAQKAKQLITADAGEMMYATIHGGNTSRRVIGEGWTEVAHEATAR